MSCLMRFYLQRNLRSMCFTRLLMPCRVAILLPTMESTWICKFNLLQILVSSKKFLRCSPSLAPMLIT